MTTIEKKGNGGYAWIIVALCFLMTFTCLGFGSSTNQLFVKSVSEHLQVSRGVYSVIQTLRHVINCVISFFFGFFVLKLGAKRLICAGFVCLSGAFAIFSFAENIWLFYLGGILLGVGFAWTGTSVIGYVINFWVKENRGTIMGAVLAANGLGGALAMQIVTPIIHSSATGFKTAYFVIACVIFAVGLLILFLFKDKPKDFQGEVKITKKKARGQGWVGIEFKTASRKAYFYVALGCTFLIGVALQGVNGVAATHMEDVGITPELIATIWSLHSIALVCFKFLTGFIYDKTGLRISSGICMLVGVAVMLCLAFVSNSPTGITLAWIYSILSSLALPLETIMLPLFASDMFGEKSYGKILGFFVSVCSAGMAVGQPLVNVCFDILGSYQIPILIFAGIFFAVFIVMQFVISKANKEKVKVIEENQVQQQG